MRRLFLLTSLLACAAAAAACTNNPTTTTPSTTNTQTFTETFTGTVTVNGADTHSFASGTGTSIVATLSSLDPNDPNNPTTVGFSMGTFNTANVCQTILSNDKANVGASITGTATTLGNFCVRVYDVGLLTAPVNYTVTVVHP